MNWGIENEPASNHWQKNLWKASFGQEWLDIFCFWQLFDSYHSNLFWQMTAVKFDIYATILPASILSWCFYSTKHRSANFFKSPFKDLQKPFTYIKRPFEDLIRSLNDLKRPFKDLKRHFQDLMRFLKDIQRPFKDLKRPF